VHVESRSVCHLATRLHGVISQTTVIFIGIVVKKANLAVTDNKVSRLFVSTVMNAHVI
jgi:hypothetical protein